VFASGCLAPTSNDIKRASHSWPFVAQRRLVILGNNGDSAMVPKGVWKPMMYGGLAGLALGALLLIAGWASPRPGICALQIASILGFGIGGGLVVGYGPARSLAWLLGVWHRDATKLVVILFCVAVPCVTKTATRRGYVGYASPEILLFDWLIVLFALMAVGPKACDTAIRRWALACCDVLAAAYGLPFVEFIEWLCVRDYGTWHGQVLAVLVFPGQVIIEAASAVIWHQYANCRSGVLSVFAGLLSVVVTVATAWWVAKRPQRRWWLPLFVVLCLFVIECSNFLARGDL
jgi:hypothetical protein